MHSKVLFPETAGYGSGDSNAQAIIMPVMAVGTSSGTIYLQNVSTLQASPRRLPACGLHHGSLQATSSMKRMKRKSFT
jgi:hypothetical protein